MKHSFPHWTGGSRNHVSLGTFGLAFAVVLSPALMDSSDSLTCAKTGDPTLSVLEVEVSGQNHITAFDPEDLSYDVWLPVTADTAIVRAYSTDPGSQVMYNFSAGSPIDYGSFPLGGGEVTLDGLLPEGASRLLVSVKAPGKATYSYLVGIHVGCSDCNDQSDCTADSCNSASQACVHTPLADGAACDFGGFPGICGGGTCDSICSVIDCDDGTTCTADTCALTTGVCAHTPLDGATCGNGAGICQGDTCVGAFACTEQGIRDAIAAGGGPHTFDCGVPFTVTTQATIVIDNDVILDGLGLLTVDGGDSHTVFLVSGATAELRGFVVTGGHPGGILNGGYLTLVDSTVSGNSASTGGGIGVGEESYTTLIDSTVSGNTAYGGSGGGIGADIAAIVSIINSTVSGNSASSSGGGISMLWWGDLSISNSTVSGNVAGGDCGGIEVGSNSFWRALTVRSSTISANAAGGTGSSVCWNGSGLSFDAKFTNSLIQGECRSSSAISEGGNIESPGDTCGLSDATDQVAVTPGQLNLGPLQDNGGPTLTHAPLPGSFAIDAIAVEDCVDAGGMPLLADQRGVSRPQGSACDVGAVEVEP